MSLRDALEFIGAGYSAATQERFKKHPMANFLRHSAPAAIREGLPFSLSSGLEIKGSAGQGAWADVPWIAIFYPVVTTSASQGFYPVYLFNLSDRSVSLSMNQGTTAVRRLEKQATREVLANRAQAIALRVKEYADAFDTGVIGLGSTRMLPKDYEAGHAFGRTYSLDDLPSEQSLTSDLQLIVQSYFALEERGGTSTAESIEAEASGLDCVIEKHIKARHVRIERSSSAARLAKHGKPAVCEVCEFDFENTYGELGVGYIEAHHLVPLSAIPVGQAMKYTADDFALLCANCHRMAHRLDDPGDLDKLKRLVGKI